MWRRRALRIDTRDARVFRGAARRTRLLGLVLALAALALLAAAAATARNLDTRARDILPRGTVGMVVLDLSLSIDDDDYPAVRRALRRLVADDSRIGLVVFSDVAYELLPPGTPAAELRPLLRLLVPPATGPTVHPWSQSFRAGTRISTALELARESLVRDGVEKPSILLVSDLETAPDDVPALTGVVQSLRRSEIALRVAPLDASSDALRIFEDLVEKEAFVLVDDAEAPPPGSRAADAVPTALLALGALLFLALAAYELFGARLGLPGPVPAREGA